jgi:peptidoglycan hydrolase CwlO-like protein
MQPRRNVRDEERGDSSEHLFPILASETVRSASNPPRIDTVHKATGDEKVSLFWRIFGGTILSIVALVVITAYQSLTNGVHELRLAMAAANEARADLVKKEEYQSSRTKIWDRLQDLQKEVGQAQAPVSQIKDRVTTLEESHKTLSGERKEIHEQQATVRERLTQFEQRLNGNVMTIKDLQMLQTSVTALQEKSTVRDQQFKQMEEEKKELLKEIQSLRERLAKIEAATTKTNAPARAMSEPVPDK